MTKIAKISSNTLFMTKTAENPYPLGLHILPICKHQQIDYSLLINNVPDFEKMSIPFLNNNNNLFLHSTLFLK